MIRKATKKDIKGFLDLQKSYEENYWKKEDFISAIKDKSIIFLVAEENNKIVGMVIGYITPTKRKEAMLHETRVLKTEQGKGIGKSLVKEFCNIAFGMKVKVIYALIKNEHLPLYIKSCGFKNTDNWIEAKLEKS